MCGIAVIFSDKADKEARLHKMMDLQVHRGPDSSGVYLDNDIAMGHRRLRVIDLDPRSDQPFCYNDYVLVFNGEIYNYRELKKELGDYSFTTESDTEVIVAAYLKWGESCLNRFNGMFSFVLYNTRTKHVFGARDRCGIKPLYYSLADGELRIASEIKALVRHGKSQPDYEAMAESLLLPGRELKDDTFFKDIEQLEQGECFSIVNGRMEKRKYYDVASYLSRSEPMSPLDAAKRFQSLLQSSLGYRLRSDVPVGLYFSGGLDSTVMAVTLQKILGAKTMVSFTASSNEVPEQECKLVAEIAESLSLEHHQCDTGEVENVSDIMKRMMWHYERPFGMSSIVNFVLNRESKRHGVTVVLEGQGGDELHGGYQHYSPYAFKQAFQDGHVGSFLKYLLPMSAKDKKEFLQASITSIMADALLKKKKNVYRNFISDELFDYLASVRREKRRRVGGALDDEIYLDFTRKLQRILHKKDRISMAFSREMRVPFLDHRIVEFMFSLPNNIRFQRGRKKPVFIDALVGMIPENIVNQPKNELLSSKVSRAMRMKMHRIAYDTLTDFTSRERGLVAPDAIGPFGSWGGYLWKLYQLELWHRVFIDGDVPLKARN